MARCARYGAVLAGVMVTASLSAQAVSPPGAIERAREHSSSIIRDLVPLAMKDSLGRVSVVVEGRGIRSVVENAALECLHERGTATVLNAGEGPAAPVLRFFLLEQSCAFTGVPNGGYLRTIRTSIEGRWESTSGVVVPLGNGVRVSLDTVQTAEQDPFSTAQADPGILETLLTPLIVVCSAAVVIYLLFTVRS